MTIIIMMMMVMTIMMTMMKIIMCFLHSKGPQTHLAPGGVRGGAINYDDYDNDDDDDDNNDDYAKFSQV